MNTHLDTCLAGVWGIRFEGGLVDRLLDAATAACDAADAAMAAQPAAEHAARQVIAAKRALSRGDRTAVAWVAAQQRQILSGTYLTELTEQWSVQALHLARVAATALNIVAVDPGAAITARQLEFGVLVSVAALEHDRAVVPPPPPTRRDRGAAARPSSPLVVAYQRVADAADGHAAHQLVACGATSSSGLVSGCWRLRCTATGSWRRRRLRW
ncbi:hypothetical protein AB0H83_29720 [Dactylosporangium sp. NPDC050688]|uniref:hypothetical protein n=1 Tax=Dactylosporangium sp. NPDC050688 TaxID=3157217 RepID=UPI0033D1DD5E